jgi:SAM-dependent methyltransferase
MGNGRNVRAIVIDRILVRWVSVRIRTIDRLDRHVALALLEHGGGLCLILPILCHDLFELVVGIVNVVNLFPVRRDQQPLVHVNDVDIYEPVLLLKALRMVRRLIAGREAAPDLHAEQFILLRLIWTNERNACKHLTWNREIVWLERTHLKVKYAYFLSKMTRQLHNRCKGDLIYKFVGPDTRVLDCGCGRGGDLHKWKKSQAREVIAIDPDEESIREARLRASESGSLVKILGTGDVRHVDGPFDVVCYNFSLHYIVDSFEESLEAINRVIVPGGLLIGIVPEKARAEMLTNGQPWIDTHGNTLEIKEGRLWVNLSDGPFYANGPREEPMLDGPEFIDRLGFEVIMWEPMLPRPNGLISDLYTKFCLRKIR